VIVMNGIVAGGEVSGPEPYGTTKGGVPVERFTLSAGKTVVKVIGYGATITEWHAPDNDGNVADVALGFDDLAGYESEANQSFGCTTGRVCNRIANGKFTLDGKTYQLALNNGPNHLHGGPNRSLAKVVWKGEKTTTDRGPGVKFTYGSPDGEEGYPGDAQFAVLYTLLDDGKLYIEWTATTDRATPVNLTNHTYFNLDGAGSPSVLEHYLSLHAQEYTAVDATLIPTGRIERVAGTPLDFIKERRQIGARIRQLDDGPTQGYDHNFVILDQAQRKGELHFAGTLSSATGGRHLKVWTTQPGIQFYTGNFLQGQTGKGGKKYVRRSACCLETQHFPDSVNHPEFPSIILRPGETYRQTCVYQVTNQLE
jgi:aldose 1-epimerase